MPRRAILSANEKQTLVAISDNQAEFIRHYSFSESDLSIIRQRRGDANRLGFAIQLCYMRFPGIILGIKQTPYPHLLNYVAQQLNISPNAWESYGLREITRQGASNRTTTTIWLSDIFPSQLPILCQLSY